MPCLLAWVPEPEQSRKQALGDFIYCFRHDLMILIFLLKGFFEVKKKNMFSGVFTLENLSAFDRKWTISRVLLRRKSSKNKSRFVKLYHQESYLLSNFPSWYGFQGAGIWISSSLNVRKHWDVMWIQQSLNTKERSWLAELNNKHDFLYLSTTDTRYFITFLHAYFIFKGMFLFVNLTHTFISFFIW